MEADEDGTLTPDAADHLSYEEQDWGDWIVGTKQQLQGLGLAVDLAFPGEHGAPEKLRVKDPRGYTVDIGSSSWRPGCFYARLRFPNWPDKPVDRPWPAKSAAPPGLKKEEGSWFDEFTGTAEALAAAGLVRPDQLPGLPGMRKVVVTIFPDGTLPIGAPNANHREANMPGARRIVRAGRSTYRVLVRLGVEEEKRRRDFESRAMEAWRRQVSTMVRPQRLTDYVRELVASRPACVRGADALATMGMLHRRKLPTGWRVIEGQRAT